MSDQWHNMNSRKFLNLITEELSVLQTALSDMPKDHADYRTMALRVKLDENLITKIQRYLDLPENAGLK